MATTSSPACDVECRLKPHPRIVLTLHLNPVPASRPRVTRWGVYYTKTYTAWRNAADQAIPLCDPQFLMEGNLQVFAMFNVLRPKTTKLTTPRSDLDNYVKAIFDAITGIKNKEPKGYWNDDVQVSSLTAHKRFVTENPSSYVVITHEGS